MAEAGSVTEQGMGVASVTPNPQDGIMGGLSRQHSKWVGLSCDTGSFHNLIRSLLSIKKNISELQLRCGSAVTHGSHSTAQRGPYTATQLQKGARMGKYKR